MARRSKIVSGMLMSGALVLTSLGLAGVAMSAARISEGRFGVNQYAAITPALRIMQKKYVPKFVHWDGEPFHRTVSSDAGIMVKRPFFQMADES